MSRIILIAAVSNNGVIGKDGKLPWELPEDLKHFMQTTRGHTVIMGRKTFESLNFVPLTKRTNVVVSSYEGPLTNKVFINGVDGSTKLIQCTDIDDAISTAVGLTDVDKDIFIIGGASVYAATIDQADEVILSKVEIDVEGDTFWDIDLSEFKLTNRENRRDSSIPFIIETFERK
jgi:dihydrofolate reductase